MDYNKGMPTIKGTKFSEEHKKNLSISLRGKNLGKKRNAEVRKKMSLAHTGKKFSKKHKKNLSLALIKTIKENGHPWTGKKHKLDWRAKVSGGKNVMWKGSNVGYVALHSWVRRHLGTPKKCDFCCIVSENGNLFEWANKSGEYHRELDDWMRLCIKCHRLLDKQRRDARK